MVSPGTSGASAASTAAWSYPDSAANTAFGVGSATSYTGIPGQVTASATQRSAGVTATAVSTSVSVAIRSTVSSASAVRKRAGSTPGGVQVTGPSNATTTRRTIPRP